MLTPMVNLCMYVNSNSNLTFDFSFSTCLFLHSSNLRPNFVVSHQQPPIGLNKILTYNLIPKVKNQT